LLSPFSSTQNVEVQPPATTTSTKLQPLSFLDQIRNRNNASSVVEQDKTNISSSETQSFTKTDIIDAPPKPKLFDRLGLGGGMSFLDQIKARRKDNE
jgi:hypothetical protein